MLIVLDCPAIAFKLRYAMAELSFNDRKTGVIYGFLAHVLRYAEKFNTNWFVFAWDSSKSYRKLTYPKYKANRTNNDLTEDEKEIIFSSKEQYKELRTAVLPKLGFKNIFMQNGIEADDIIASTVRNVKHWQAITDITVVSRDNDLWQLLDDCDLLDPMTNKIYTAEMFEKDHGIKPHQWAEVKCLCGCATDNVDNVPGVAAKTAIKYLQGSLKKGKVKDLIESDEGKAIVQRNKDLVVLPHSKTKRIWIQDDETFLQDNFISTFEDYGFESFLNVDRFNKWRKFFHLK